MKIYHYTSIENLALILKNKTLKFNSLSNVDDMEEGKTEDFGDLSKFVFVSCWSNSSEENIALWNMYSNKMSGIRIELESNDILFERLHDKSSLIKNVSKLQENEYAWLWEQDDKPLIKVDYTRKRTPKLVKRDEDNFPIIYINNIASYKRSIWKFQKEVRFILIAAKTTNKSKVGILKAILEETNTTAINANCLYLQLSEKSFKHMKILLGPHTEEYHRIMCEALVEKYLPNYSIPISNSNLQIRK